MAGLSHRDVALLNSSLEGLGNTFMQNRLLDEKMKEREEERAYREGRDSKQDQYRQDTLNEKKRSNEIKSAGTVELYAVQGKNSMGWHGPPEGIESFKKLAQQSGEPGEPIKFTSTKPSTYQSTVKVNDFVSYGFASPQDAMDFEKTNAEWLDEMRKKSEEEKLKYMRNSDMLSLDRANKLLDEAAKLEAAGDHENAEKNREDAARLKLGVGRAEAADPQEQLLQGDRKRKLSLLRAGIAALKMKMLEDDATEDAKARYAQAIDKAETEIAELLGTPRPQPRGPEPTKTATGSRFKIIGTK